MPVSEDVKPQNGFGSERRLSSSQPIEGPRRGRRKWSEGEMHALIFCYYKARAQGVGILKALERLFKDRYPYNLEVEKYTGSLLSNHARSIIARKCVPSKVINELKLKAELDVRLESSFQKQAI